MGQEIRDFKILWIRRRFWEGGRVQITRNMSPHLDTTTKAVFSTNGAGATGQPHAKKWM